MTDQHLVNGFTAVRKIGRAGVKLWKKLRCVSADISLTSVAVVILPDKRLTFLPGSASRHWLCPHDRKQANDMLTALRNDDHRRIMNLSFTGGARDANETWSRR